jgi:hypothetical protein
MVINHLPDISTEVEGLHSKKKVSVTSSLHILQTGDWNKNKTLWLKWQETIINAKNNFNNIGLGSQRKRVTSSKSRREERVVYTKSNEKHAKLHVQTVTCEKY